VDGTTNVIYIWSDTAALRPDLDLHLHHASYPLDTFYIQPSASSISTAQHLALILLLHANALTYVYILDVLEQPYSRALRYILSHPLGLEYRLRPFFYDEIYVGAETPGRKRGVFLSCVMLCYTRCVCILAEYFYAGCT
jgi:hypothetical protein